MHPHKCSLFSTVRFVLLKCLLYWVSTIPLFTQPATCLHFTGFGINLLSKVQLLVVSRKRAHGRYTLLCALTGGGRIFDTGPFFARLRYMYTESETYTQENWHHWGGRFTLLIRTDLIMQARISNLATISLFYLKL